MTADRRRDHDPRHQLVGPRLGHDRPELLAPVVGVLQPRRVRLVCRRRGTSGRPATGAGGIRVAGFRNGQQFQRAGCLHVQAARDRRGESTQLRRAADDVEADIAGDHDGLAAVGRPRGHHVHADADGDRRFRRADLDAGLRQLPAARDHDVNRRRAERHANAYGPVLVHCAGRRRGRKPRDPHAHPLALSPGGGASARIHHRHDELVPTRRLHPVPVGIVDQRRRRALHVLAHALSRGNPGDARPERPATARELLAVSHGWLHGRDHRAGPVPHIDPRDRFARGDG